MTVSHAKYRPITMIGAVVLMGLFVMMGLSGCGDRSARMDKRDLNHPLVKKALRFKQDGDMQGAVSLLQQALEERPDLARAHLELGLLFDSPNGDDFVRAIYHYRRYLEMRPKSEKRDIIEGLILGARLSYAATIPNQPSGAVDMIAKLKHENKSLRMRILAMEKAGYASTTPVSNAVEKTSEKTTVAVAKTSKKSSAGPRYYVVEKSDSLSRIANKVYGDAREWRRIYDANRKELSSPESLRLGQKLLIPNL